MTDKRKTDDGDDAPTEDNVLIFKNRPKRAALQGEPVFNLPPATQFLILSNLVIHAVLSLAAPQISVEIFYRLGFVSARYTGGMPLTWEAFVSPLTYMFVHGGWTHLLMNVAMLAAFGAGVERQIGSRRMLVFFLLTGFLSAWFHMLFYWNTEGVLIGASGGISGLFGGVLILLYRKGHLDGGVRGLYPAIAIWIVMAVLFGFIGAPGAEGATIAWTAHIGGFAAGLLLYRYFDPSR